jgi:hypothetical protein
MVLLRCGEVAEVVGLLVVNKAEAQHKEVARPQCHTTLKRSGFSGHVRYAMLGEVEKSLEQIIFGKIECRLVVATMSSRVETCYHAHWGFHVAVESHGDERSRAQAKNATISKGRTKKTHTITSLPEMSHLASMCCGV